MDGSLVDHWAISLKIKSISGYLQRLRVIPQLDHYYIGIHFAPNSLTQKKKVNKTFLKTLDDYAISKRV